MRIVVSEVNNSSSKLEFSWLPSEIKDAGGNILYAVYTLLDRGEVARGVGNDLQKVSWESLFPGEARAEHAFLAAEWVDPAECDELLKRWKAKRKMLNLTIEDTNISQFKCYIETYESSHSGGFGDIYYSLSFQEYKPINIQVIKKQSNGKKDTTKRPTPSTTSYTVKKGDCLWNIAAKYLGKGSRWKEIYNLNKSAIENAAKKYGKKSSDNGHWIYPGTKLKLPKK